MSTTNNHANEITLNIDSPRLTADMFTRGTNAFFGFIQAVTSDIVGKEQTPVWIVSVKSGSVNIIASPEALNGNSELISAAMNALDEGIKLIEEKAERPPYFSDEALKRIHTLASIVDGKDMESNQVKIWIDRRKRELTHNTVAHVNSILRAESKTYGSVDGKLNMLADRYGSLRFEIYDRANENNVKCYIDEEMIEEVVKGFRRRVVVHGLMRYRKDGTVVSIEVEEFKILSKKPLPDFYDVLGILKD